METSRRVRVAVVGATGYAGAELVRLLGRHPGVSITIVTSERDAGNDIGLVHPSLSGLGLGLVHADVTAIAQSAEVAFCALPHGSSTALVAGLLERGLKVIDLGADFRFSDLDLYKKWYGDHGAPELNDSAVYGLSEYFRDAIRGAELVANPGCYPTGALMALLPLARFIKGSVIVDSKSGTSGAGRAAKVEQLFAEVSSNVRAYNIGTHRHQGEIGEQLSSAAGARVPVLFSPHLLPIARGLLSTCYVNLGSGADVGALMQDAYGDEPFVSLKGEGVFPEPKKVRGTNRVEIGWHTGSETGVSVIVTAIDNLGKGAAGQAVQNFNLMCGFEETSGLDLIPALP